MEDPLTPVLSYSDEPGTPRKPPRGATLMSFQKDLPGRGGSESLPESSGLMAVEASNVPLGQMRRAPGQKRCPRTASRFVEVFCPFPWRFDL